MPLGKYKILDVGTYKGELLSSILKELPDYDLYSIGLDVDEEFLFDNNIANKNIKANANNITLEENAVDISIMRYVLQWNNYKDQREIIRKLVRVTDKIILIQHVGSSINDSKEWRKRMNKIFSGEKIHKLKRYNYFFSSKKDIENIFSECELDFEVIQHRKIQNASDVYTERYNLNKEEESFVKEIMGDMNYFYQTTWIIRKS